MTNKWLTAAHQTADFLETQAVATAAGKAWRRTPDKDRVNHTLYHGSAGISLFYLELYQASADSQWLTSASAAGDQLLHYLNDKISTGAPFSVALYSGWSGYVFVLDQLAQATDDQRYADMAKRVYQHIMQASTELGAGVGWIEPMPFSDITGHSGDREIYDFSVGAAGVGIVSLYAYRQGLHPEALEHARKICDRLLEVAEQTEHGLRWHVMADMPWQFNAPNFAHGAAGVGYLLAATFEATQDNKYLEAAIKAATFVQSHAIEHGDGHLVCHTEEAGAKGPFYLGVCHGPAGTGRLMYLLHKITGEQHWLDWLVGNMRGLLATGAPEQRSAGLWQNYSQCCGDAGIGDYACNLYRATNQPMFRELAERVGEVVLSQAENIDGTIAWSQAEHRSRPDFVETQTGYMQGAAGIGSFLINLATLDAPKSAKIAHPDAPF